MEVVKDYIGWWMLIVAVVIVLCTSMYSAYKFDIEYTNRVTAMTTHCESQGKTLLANDGQPDLLVCI
jgi:hypothetical protein